MMKAILRAIPYTVFWTWNSIFLIFVSFGILPFSHLLIVEAWLGRVPWDFVATLLALIAIPIVCTVLGCRSRIRNRPLQMLRLFFCVEAPLFCLALLRLFLMRQLSPASALVLGTVVLGIAFYLFRLLGRSGLLPSGDRRWGGLSLTGHAILLAVGAYIVSLLSFYVLPTTMALISGIGWAFVHFFRFDWVSDVWRYPGSLIFGGLAVLLFGMSAAVFVSMPFVLSGTFTWEGVQGVRAFAARFGRRWAIAGTTGLLALWVAAFAILQVQPQVRAFALLDAPLTAPASRQALMAQSETVRGGLLNAYLHAYRYLSPREANTHVYAMYRDLLGNEAIATRLQAANNLLLSPFLYQGDRDDDRRAAELYAQFFDTSIQKAEGPAIQQALQATYDRSEVAAGLLDAHLDTVWLARQDLTVTPQGDWADIEIHEVYDNQTFEQQETFYTFSLPESAVLTGLWLGESDNRDERFVYTISPRGAAQQVYRDQVRRRVDPALLEQVGPQQYRLRAFPIPARTNAGKAVPMHLWLTYKTMQQGGSWPLPQAIERRNVYWTRRTRRTQNGQTVAARADRWFPAYLPAATEPEPQIHRVTLPEGYEIAVEPMSTRGYQQPSDRRIALVLDTSRSMGERAAELAETSRWLDATLKRGNVIDLYRTASAGLAPSHENDIQHFSTQETEFYGTLSLPEMLEQFQTLRRDTTYDAILLVTDAGSYDLARDDANVTVPDAPLWLVHLGGFPGSYDDATLAAVQDSGGGIAGGVQAALQRWATEASLQPNVASVTDGYIWYADPVETTGSELAESDLAFAPLAARQAVLHVNRAARRDHPADPQALVDLDTIHALAERYSMVTPYSSAIVLVNDAQREALARAEAASDRFDREVETGVETLTQPANPLAVSGVPEPEEWLMMSLASAGMVGLVWYRRRQQGVNKA